MARRNVLSPEACTPAIRHLILSLAASVRARESPPAIKRDTLVKSIVQYSATGIRRGVREQRPYEEHSNCVIANCVLARAESMICPACAEARAKINRRDIRGIMRRSFGTVFPSREEAHTATSSSALLADAKARQLAFDASRCPAHWRSVTFPRQGGSEIVSEGIHRETG